MIAGATNGNCVQRAVSTMRLALGYEAALPENWTSGGKATRELVGSLSDWFPDREIFLACLPILVEGKTLSPLVKYLGTTLDLGLGEDDVNEDEYLIAFTYKTNEDGSRSHILIGTPWGFDPDDLQVIQVIFGVSLDFAQSSAQA